MNINVKTENSTSNNNINNNTIRTRSSSSLDQQTSNIQPQPQPSSKQVANNNNNTTSTTINSNNNNNSNNNEINKYKPVFGWTCIDEDYQDTTIPYLIKEDVKYFAVRILDKIVLSKYPAEYPPEVQALGSLTSVYCNEIDVSILNEINNFHVNFLYGKESFTIRDHLVKCDDFLKFYNVLKNATVKNNKNTTQSQQNRPVQNKLFPPQSLSKIPQQQQQNRPMNHQQLPQAVQRVQQQQISNQISSQQNILNRPPILTTSNMPRAASPMPNMGHPINLNPQKIVQMSTLASNPVSSTHLAQNQMCPTQQMQYVPANYRQIPSPIFQNQSQQQLLMLQQKQQQIQQQKQILIQQNQQTQQQFYHQQNQYLSMQRMNQQQMQHNPLPQQVIQPIQQPGTPPVPFILQMNTNIQSNSIQLSSINQNGNQNVVYLNQPSQFHQRSITPQVIENSNVNSTTPPIVIVPTLSNQPSPITAVILPSASLTPPLTVNPISTTITSTVSSISPNIAITENLMNVQPIEVLAQTQAVVSSQVSPVKDSEKTISEPPAVPNLPSRHSSPRTSIDQRSVPSEQSKINEINISSSSTSNETNSSSGVLSTTNTNPITTISATETTTATTTTNISSNATSVTLTSTLTDSNPVTVSSSTTAKIDSKPTTATSSSPVDSPKLQPKSNISDASDEIEILDSCKSDFSGGWLQLNEKLIAYIDLKEHVYKLTERFVKSTKYVPLEEVIRQNILTADHKLQTEKKATKEQAEFINKLLINLDKNNTPTYAYESLKLINVHEVIYETEKANFLKRLPLSQPRAKVIKNYLDILNLRGGLLILKKNIIPFVSYENKKIVPHGCMLAVLDRYYETTNSIQFPCNNELLMRFKEFYELVIFYVSIEINFTRSVKLLDITLLCDKYPNDFKLLCQFTEKFPLDWKYSIKKFLAINRSNQNGNNNNDNNNNSDGNNNNNQETTNNVEKNGTNEISNYSNLDSRIAQNTINTNSSLSDSSVAKSNEDKTLNESHHEQTTETANNNVSKKVSKNNPINTISTNDSKLLPLPRLSPSKSIVAPKIQSVIQNNQPPPLINFTELQRTNNNSSTTISAKPKESSTNGSPKEISNTNISKATATTTITTTTTTATTTTTTSTTAGTINNNTMCKIVNICSISDSSNNASATELNLDLKPILTKSDSFKSTTSVAPSAVTTKKGVLNKQDHNKNKISNSNSTGNKKIKISHNTENASDLQKTNSIKTKTELKNSSEKINSKDVKTSVKVDKDDQKIKKENEKKILKTNKNKQNKNEIDNKKNFLLIADKEDMDSECDSQRNLNKDRHKSLERIRELPLNSLALNKEQNKTNENNETTKVLKTTENIENIDETPKSNTNKSFINSPLKFHKAICESVKLKRSKQLQVNLEKSSSASTIGSYSGATFKSSSSGTSLCLKSLNSGEVSTSLKSKKQSNKRKISNIIRRSSTSSTTSKSTDTIESKKSKKRKRKRLYDSTNYNIDDDSSDTFIDNEDYDDDFSHYSELRLFNENSCDSDLSYNLRQRSLKSQNKKNNLLNFMDKRSSTSSSYLNNLDLFTSEEFDEEFYLKKYEIKPCKVVIQKLI